MKGGGIVKAIDLQIGRMYIFKNLKLKTSKLNGIFKGRKDKDITQVHTHVYTHVYTFLDNMNNPFEIILEDDELFEEMDDDIAGEEIVYKSTLKELYSSGTKEILENKYKTKKTICLAEHFKQHEGECWNDTIQYMLAFTDNIKESVQRKLFNLTPDEIIKLAELNNRDYLIPYHLRNENAKLAEKYKTYLHEYLQNYKDRLLIYEQKSQLNPSTNLYKMQKIKRQDTREISIDSAIAGLQISDRICKKKGTHGGDIVEGLNLLMLLSYVFLEDTESLVYYFDLDDIEIDKIDCVIISYQTSKSWHSTAFLTCDKNSIFYNDNQTNTNINMQVYLNNIKDKNNSSFIYKDNKLNKSLPGYQNNITKKCFDINNIEIEESNIRSSNIKFIYIIKETINKEEYNSKYNDVFTLFNVYNDKYYNYYNKIITLNTKFITNNDLVLMYASINYEKNINLLKIIIDNINLDHMDINNMTPLMIALEKRYNKKIIQLYLNKGSKINHVDINNDTPLMIALKNKNDIKIIQLLLDNGADVNHIDINKETPLFWALDYLNDIKIIQLLLDNGANINYENVNKITPLMIALKYKNDIKIIQLLLDNGADVNHIDKNKESPLFWALDYHNDINIIQLLLQYGADLHHENENKLTALMVALKANNSIDIIEFLLLWENDEFDINYEFDINHESTSKNTALMIALKYNNPIEIIQLLLEKGSDINHMNIYNDTPLIIALHYINPIEIIQLLLEKGADINHMNIDNMTPLMVALEKENSKEIIKLLENYQLKI